MMRAEIGSLTTGARVRDRFARVGTVHRETFGEGVENPVHRFRYYMPASEHVGVLWDGGNGSIIAYPEETQFELLSEAAS